MRRLIIALALLLLAGCNMTIRIEPGTVTLDPFDPTPTQEILVPPTPQIRVNAGITANIRTGPSTNNAILTTVTGGSVLTLVNEQPNWFQVMLPDGRIGWLFSSLGVKQ